MIYQKAAFERLLKQKRLLAKHFSIRPFQHRAFEAIATGQDVFVVADTGKGKSLIQQCGFLLKETKTVKKPIALHIGPLIALANGQVTDLNDKVSCKYVTPSTIDAQVKRGDYQNLYVSPETLFHKDFLDVLISPIYQRRLKFVCFDEADCVTWKTFRADFGKLQKLRAFCPDAQFLAATATVAAWQYPEICERLRLRNPVLIRDVPSPTIKWSVHKRPDDFRVVLDPIIQTIREQGRSAERILIACSDANLKRHNAAYRYLMSELGAQANDDDGNVMIAKYHSKSGSAHKRAIETSLRDPSGSIRVVVCSSALGRGANYPDISKVIFLHCPSSLEELWQFGGRAGRSTDGSVPLRAEGIVYYTNSDIPSDHASRSLIAFVNLPRSGCRREYSLNYFRFPGDPTPTKGNHHECCDLCAKRCECQPCNSISPRKRHVPGVVPLPKRPSPMKETDISPKKRPLSPSSDGGDSKRHSPEKEHKNVDDTVNSDAHVEILFRKALMDYFLQISNHGSFEFSSTSLNLSLIDELVTGHEDISSPMALALLYGLRQVDASLVWNMLTDSRR